MRAYQVLMTEQEIARYNLANEALPNTQITALEKTSSFAESEAIRAHQAPLPFPKEPRFDGCGHFIGENFYKQLAETMDWASATGKLTARYALVTKQSALRTVPTQCPSYRQRWRADLDRFQVTLLKLGEPVLIWHQSSDGQWLFIQNRHAWGWTRRENIALLEEKLWRQWAGEREFVQLLSSREIIAYSAKGKPCQQLLLMGTHLTCYDYSHAGYIVLLPQRSEEGYVQMEQILLPKDERFAFGYVPFSQSRLLEQGLRCLGEPYGWGGENGYRDCTSLVDDVFGVFGFRLARNSSAQRQMAGVQPISLSLGEVDKEALVDTLPIGTVLYLPGHAMIYCGRRGDKQVILHGVYQMGLPMAQEIITYPAKQIMRGYLRQLRVDGQSFLASLTDYWCPWQ